MFVRHLKVLTWQRSRCTAFKGWQRMKSKGPSLCQGWSILVFYCKNTCSISSHLTLLTYLVFTLKATATFVETLRRISSLTHRKKGVLYPEKKFFHVTSIHQKVLRLALFAVCFSNNIGIKTTYLTNFGIVIGNHGKCYITW